MQERVYCSIDVQSLVGISFHFHLQTLIEDLPADHGLEQLSWDLLLRAPEDQVTPIIMAQVPESQTELLLLDWLILLSEDIKLASHYNDRDQ
jgi:hypothetical protein